MISTSNKKVRRKALNPKSKPSNDLENWYLQMPEHLKPKLDNPAFDHHKISMPFRIVLVGTSGSGKTNLLVSTLYRMPSTFSHIVLCCPMPNEPLYAFMRSKLKPDEITICENVASLPDLNSLPHEKGDHTLVIFDDMVVERNQRPIADYFIRCRKQPASVFYLSQSYFQVPKIIRQQASHVWLRKMSGIRDIKLVMSDYNMDLTPYEMWRMYSDCVEQGSFLNIAITDPERERFRCGYLEVIDPRRYKGIEQRDEGKTEEEDTDYP
jgi:hypothetical protein